MTSEAPRGGLHIEMTGVLVVFFRGYKRTFLADNGSRSLAEFILETNYPSKRNQPSELPQDKIQRVNCNVSLTDLA